MATMELTRVVNMVAGEDLRSDVYELLQIENDGGVAKVIKATGPTNTCVGILAEDPNPDFSTDGFSVPVALFDGIVPMKAGATITAGQLVIADSTAGRVAGVADIAALAADTMAVGVALESAVDGDIFNVLGMPLSSATET